MARVNMCHPCSNSNNIPSRIIPSRILPGSASPSSTAVHAIASSPTHAKCFFFSFSAFSFLIRSFAGPGLLPTSNSAALLRRAASLCPSHHHDARPNARLRCGHTTTTTRDPPPRQRPLRYVPHTALTPHLQPATKPHRTTTPPPSNTPPQSPTKRRQNQQSTAPSRCPAPTAATHASPRGAVSPVYHHTPARHTNPPPGATVPQHHQNPIAPASPPQGPSAPPGYKHQAHRPGKSHLHHTPHPTANIPTNPSIKVTEDGGMTRNEGGHVAMRAATSQ